MAEVKDIVENAIKDNTSLETPELLDAAESVNKEIEAAEVKEDVKDEVSDEVADTFEEKLEDKSPNLFTVDSLIAQFDEAVDTNRQLQETLEALQKDYEKVKNERTVLLKRVQIGFRDAYSKPISELHDAKSSEDAAIASISEDILNNI